MSFPFDSNLSSPSPSRDPVEKLLGQIAQRAIASSLITQAAAWSGCGPTDVVSSDDAPTASQIGQQEQDETKPESVCNFSDGIIDFNGLRLALDFECAAICDGTASAQAGRDPDDQACSLIVPQPSCPNGAVEPAQCLPVACPRNTLLTDREGEVRRWTTSEEVLKVLGLIDSVDDAMLYLAASGYRVCADRASSELPNGEGFLVYGTMPGASDRDTFREIEQRIRVGLTGQLTLLGTRVRTNPRVAVGRVPEKVTLPESDAGVSVLGDFLAGCAALEAASVPAFAHLARELAAHGAPPELIARAEEAQVDEERHTRIMAALARARGGIVRMASIPPQPVRMLVDVARENAVEGCVRETFGALIAAFQCAHAEDCALRGAMEAIAADEARHAALSHAVHAWLLPQLNEVGRTLVQAAQRQAIRALAEEWAAGNDERLARAAGLPSTDTAREMLDILSRTLWQSASQESCPAS